MSEDLTVGIVRILDGERNTAGVGFVLASANAAEILIATCSHVVQTEEASEPRPESVTVVFHATGEERAARVEPDWWRDFDKGDVAILRLEGARPAGVQPLLLGSSAGTSGHQVRTFGFPAVGKVEGVWGRGEVLGPTTEAGQPLLQVRSSEITSCFSGAPVWDEATRRVIGMQVLISTPEDYLYERLQETAFIIPAETLRAVCPALRLSDLCPYRNLAAFTEADAAFFFGRQEVVRRLVESLRSEPRFLAVLGPSGSGKSSLVQAGLIPQLRSGRLPDSNHWEVLSIRPADNPFAQLAAHGLAHDSGNLIATAQEWLARQTRLVLVIDQFEELLVTCPQPVRESFVAQLTELLESSLPVTVIITLRDDFYNHFVQQAPSLVRWLERGLVNVPPTLTPEELTAIVEEPARAVGWTLEAGLAQTIVNDAEVGGAARSTVLPLVGFTLTQLWAHRQDGSLTHSAYTNIGGVTGGLTRWADQRFYELDKGMRLWARRILTDLVYLGDQSQGLPDSRRRRLLADLCQDGLEKSLIHQIAQQLADARLLITARDKQSGQETVELIHDALLREWGLLQQWLREDRRFLLWRQEIEGRTQAWARTNPAAARQRDDGKLLRGRDLVEAEDWLEGRSDDLNEEERSFICASLGLRDRERAASERLRRRVIVGLTAGLLVVLLSFLVALSLYLKSEAQLANARAFALCQAANEGSFDALWESSAGSHKHPDFADGLRAVLDNEAMALDSKINARRALARLENFQPLMAKLAPADNTTFFEFVRKPERWLRGEPQLAWVLGWLNNEDDRMVMWAARTLGLAHEIIAQPPFSPAAVENVRARLLHLLATRQQAGVLNNCRWALSKTGTDPSRIALADEQRRKANATAQTHLGASEIKDLGLTLVLVAPPERQKPFYLSDTEITVEQFRRFVEATPGFQTSAEKEGRSWCFGDNGVWYFPTCLGASWRNLMPAVGRAAAVPNLPVVHVSWDDAAQFCNWLSVREGLEACYEPGPQGSWKHREGSNGYRLPTVEEWQMSSRAGTTTAFWWADNAVWQSDKNWRCLFANLPDASFSAKWPTLNAIAGSDDYVFHAPAKTFTPNDWGFFETIGNVTEWGDDEQQNNGKPRLGGSWGDHLHELTRTDRRDGNNTSSVNVGFRVARTAPQSTARTN